MTQHNRTRVVIIGAGSAGGLAVAYASARMSTSFYWTHGRRRAVAYPFYRFRLTGYFAWVV